jgi:predicted  nucleic acid-binding Zn-ribbon protein
MSLTDIPDFIAREIDVSEEIDALWVLRGLDDQIVALNAALSRFPEQRATIERRLAGERERLEKLKARVGDIQKKRRELEVEIASFSTQENKFKSQLPAIKKNEEYTALLHEIDGVKRKRSDLETEVLLQMEAEEKEQGERPAVENALKSAEREAGERKAQIAAEEKLDQERVAALEAERAGHLARLSSGVRSRYERIRTSREGRAVVAIVKGACGGCFRAQPPQVLQEAKRRDRMLSCEGCGRILVWPPEAQAPV